MNTQTMILITLICINTLLGIAIIFNIAYFASKVKQTNDTNKKLLLFNLPINNEENFLILDRLISDEINIYKIYNFPPLEEDMYINEEDQNKMIRVVLTQVLKKISPVYIEKLKYIYNEIIIEDIIYEKIRDSVMNFTIEINGEFR